MVQNISHKILSFLSKSKFKQLHRDGTIEIAVGLIFAIFAYDRYVQHLAQERKAALHQEKTRFLQHVVQVEQAKKNEVPIKSSTSSSSSSGVEQQHLTREQIFSQINSLDAETSRSHMALKFLNRPAKFQCIVKRIPIMFDGHLSLVGIEVNDIVDVLEENVGPDKLYNICRPLKAVNESLPVGWFPKNCLEKIDRNVKKGGECSNAQTNTP